MAAGADGGHDPLHQFEIYRWLPIKNFFGYDASFTNAAFFMVLAVVLISGFLILSMRGRSLVPTRMQSMAEVIYEFLAKTLRDICGPEGMRYFPFVFSLFTFILVLNLLGIVPSFFTVTSHIVVTFALAALVFLFVTGLGFAKHGFGYLKMFVPHGVPLPLLPLIIPIEVLSYLMRPISLSVRLFANMLAGHILLKVLAGFVVGMGALGGWIPLIFMIGFTGFEVMVAVLQAFIFTVLTCIYLNDALNMHH